MKPGSRCVPNCLLNRSTQKKLNAPQDGVSALAAVAVASVLAARTPPTMVSDAAVASTLLLMDMEFPSWNPAVPCARLAELAPATCASDVARLPRHIAGSRRPDRDRKRAVPTGSAVQKGEDPGGPGGSRDPAGCAGSHPFTLSKDAKSALLVDTDITDTHVVTKSQRDAEASPAPGSTLSRPASAAPKPTPGSLGDNQNVSRPGQGFGPYGAAHDSGAGPR